jgi:hypothetical protein
MYGHKTCSFHFMLLCQKHCNICLFFQVNSRAVILAHMLLRTMLTMQQCINAKSD